MKRKLQGAVQAMFKFKKGAPNLELLCLLNVDSDNRTQLS